MTPNVREPIQVYLTEAERARLDASAGALGVSRSEVLRRGIDALQRPLTGADVPDALTPLVDRKLLTPARSSVRAVPASLPVAPLAEVLAGLELDRSDR